MIIFKWTLANMKLAFTNSNCHMFSCFGFLRFFSRTKRFYIMINRSPYWYPNPSPNHNPEVVGLQPIKRRAELNGQYFT